MSPISLIYKAFNERCNYSFSHKQNLRSHMFHIKSYSEEALQKHLYDSKSSYLSTVRPSSSSRPPATCTIRENICRKQRRHVINPLMLDDPFWCNQMAYVLSPDDAFGRHSQRRAIIVGYLPLQGFHSNVSF